ncbi:MAG: MFS transporter, partial [Woeseiaceae bacterium]|nr:MFS transporter [Woeseiaceae bacterium]
MASQARATALISLLVALGGFLMGFDASVISGVVGFIETEFELTKIELGWSVASLTLTATLAMMVAGPLSDRIGRRPVLQIAAAMFAVSAVASAVAPDFITLVIARMLGGFGVGDLQYRAPANAIAQGAGHHHGQRRRQCQRRDRPAELDLG